MRNIISPWGLFHTSFPFPVPVLVPIPFLCCLPLPLPHPLPVFSCLLFPLPICCSLSFPGRFLTALHGLLPLAVVIVIAIAMMASCTARQSGICPVLIIIIHMDYLIQIQWSNGQEGTWLGLLAASQLNLCPEIITNVPREMLARAFNLPRDSYLQIREIDSIFEDMRVVPPPIVHLVAGFVKHLPHIWAEGYWPLLKTQTHASSVWPHQLELWKVASHDWIKIHYII